MCIALKMIMKLLHSYIPCYRQTMLIWLLVFFCIIGRAVDRSPWDKDWRFTLADLPQMAQNNYDDRRWRILDLPHDWAIEGDFYVSNPSGAVGGALPGGVGWYRKHLVLNDQDDTSRYQIDFDGVFMNSSVYINGHLLGVRPYGFISFRYDLTPYLNKHGDNVIAVRVDNSRQPNCRWYSGCGIYRHVYLVRSSDIHVAHWGIQILSKVYGNKAHVDITTQIVNESNTPQKLVVRHTLLDTTGKVVACTSNNCFVRDSDFVLSQQLHVTRPHLWSVRSPYLYRLKTELLTNGRVIDIDTTTTGIRTITFDSLYGFSLNGERMKINGVCMHGDLGCLGTAIYEDALYRQLKMLKDMGANAIRCSHNPPAPELLNMCDSMGLLVLDEAFDEWHNGKTKYDYALYFDKWFERDLADMVLRDRNHPSIILWSIGNEVLEQWSKANTDSISLEEINILLNNNRDALLLANDEQLSANSRLTQVLASIVRKYDRSRPITAGCNEVSPDNHLFKSGALDVIGFNYHYKQVKDIFKRFSHKPFIMTESVSALQTRGCYKMPSDSVFIMPGKRRPYIDPTFICSAYDNSYTSWGSTHEATWDVVKHTPYCSGQFIWAGWDYIGEPTPFNFPARSSYFGIIDLAGFPKDSYYMYQSEWTDKTVLHLFPHWNWIEGQTVDLWCYYNNADEVELFVNGKSQGVRCKEDIHQYHVMWRVVYQPGEIRAVSRSNGDVVAMQIIHTAGAPHHLRLTSDKHVLSANGRSLAFITVEVVDKDGNLCPWADNDILFSVSGNAKIAGVDNGCPFSLERFKDNHRKAFGGKCLVVLQAEKVPSIIQLTAKSIGLTPQTIYLNAQ